MLFIGEGRAEMFSFVVLSRKSLAPRRKTTVSSNSTNSSLLQGVQSIRSSFKTFSHSNALTEAGSGVELEAGSYLSEASLWTKWLHTSTVRYIEHGVVLIVDAVQLANVCIEYS